MTEPMIRRELLRRAALLGGAVLLGGPALTWGDEDKDERRVRSKEPLNLEFPFERLAAFKTRTRLHYVRNHYPVPKLDPRAWRLEVSGAVDRPLRLTLDDLLKMKSSTMPVTLECAGNGRSRLPVKVKGVQWDLGAVSTADWTGVRLADVLDRAGVQKGAVEVVLDSADKGDPKKDGQPPLPVSFARSLPLAKALRPEVLLAHQMNGAALPANHGAPLRAIVAGWFGMASVKWLTRIIVTKDPFLGFDQTIDYSYWRKGDDGLPRLVPITGMEPKASIARPAVGEKVPAGKEYRIFGAAWAGEQDVTKVEVSIDGGKTWRPAKFLDEPTAYCWRRWELAWTPPKGKSVVMARATDRSGRTQPTSHDPGRRSYMISFVQPTPVEGV